MSQKRSEKKSAILSQSCGTSTSITSKILAQVGPDVGSSQSVKKKPRLSDINAELTCILCNGYLIDATTISECLHSFCKSCIVRYLETNKSCPICEVQVHGTKPLHSIRSDKILQDIVYKLIPDVFKNEMKRRRDFYAKHPEAAESSAEDRGEVVDERIFYMSNDQISLSLEYGYGENQIPENGYHSNAGTQSDETNESEGTKRYLLCPAGLSILTLKKFIARKYGLPTTYKVDIMYLEDILSEDYTLMDVAYIYAWRRSDPMRLFYRISERPIKRLKTTHPQKVESKSGSGVDSNETTISDVKNKSNSGVVSQSKLVQTQASSCTLRTTTSSTLIITGAAPVPTLTSMKAQHSSNKGNNSGATGVTSGKASTSTPRRADPSKSVSTVSQTVSTVSTQPTPPGILKSKATHMSASSVQTDEPPKKLRKILPNNSSVSTPKSVPKPLPTDCVNANTSSPVIPLTPLSTSTSTVNSLRQCRINSDKSKLCSSANSLGYNTAPNVSPNLGLSVSNTSTKSDKCMTNDNSVQQKRNITKKCSAFDVRTLIGTKSPTLQSSRHSVESMSGKECVESKEEKTINDKNLSSDCKSATQTSKQSKGSAREVNRNKLTSSQSSMPSTLPSMTTGSTQNKKQAMNSPSVESVRPPTNKSSAPNNRVLAPPDSSRALDSMPSKQTKSVTNVSSKQLNVKSMKSSENETNVKSCLTNNREITTDKTNKICAKPMSGVKSETAQHHSTPLSPTSIRIKLPQMPNNKNSCKSSALGSRATTPSSTSLVSSHHNNKETNHSIESFVSKTDSKKQCLDNKTSETGHKSLGSASNQSLSKSSISQSSSKTKGASINQIVSKIASGVTAKSASVNVTSTTPTLELNTKTNTNVPQLSSGSNEVTPNELNDNKVSTTTTDSSVGSAIHKSESAIKSVSAVTSAATNSGNLVIRISTKNHSVESLVSPKDREKKFEIKRDSNNSSDNTSKVNNSWNSQIDNKSDDKNSKNEKQIKTSNKETDESNEEEDDDDIDGKLVVDVPNDDSCERDITNSKTIEVTKIGDNKESAALKADNNSSKSSQSNAFSVKSTKISDISTKLAINISTAHQLSANSAVLASPPPTPTPSPKSESDPMVTNDNKSNSCSPSNGPLDLSMSTKKDRNVKQSISPVPIRAIYDIPPPKPKHCVNPAVLDKHRGLFPTANAPKQQYQSFKIMSSQSQGVRQSSGSSLNSSVPNNEATKKNRSIGSPIVSSNTTTTSNQSNTNRHRSLSHNNHSHHHNSHHNHKTYSVITPDPHRYTPKLVIRNIGSPPSITSHFNYPTHH